MSPLITEFRATTYSISDMTMLLRQREKGKKKKKINYFFGFFSSPKTPIELAIDFILHDFEMAG